jgi:hypothetical protein
MFSLETLSCMILLISLSVTTAFLGGGHGLSVSVARRMFLGCVRVGSACRFLLLLEVVCHRLCGGSLREFSFSKICA